MICRVFVASRLKWQRPLRTLWVKLRFDIFKKATSSEKKLSIRKNYFLVLLLVFVITVIVDSNMTQITFLAKTQINFFRAYCLFVSISSTRRTYPYPPSAIWWISFKLLPLMLKVLEALKNPFKSYRQFPIVIIIQSDLYQIKSILSSSFLQLQGLIEVQLEEFIS